MNAKLTTGLLALTIAAGTAGLALVAPTQVSASPAVHAPAAVQARWEVPPRHAAVQPATFMRGPSRIVAGPTVVAVSMGKAPSRIVAGPLFRKCC